MVVWDLVFQVRLNDTGTSEITHTDSIYISIKKKRAVIKQRKNNGTISISIDIIEGCDTCMFTLNHNGGQRNGTHSIDSVELYQFSRTIVPMLGDRTLYFSQYMNLFFCVRAPINL